jgi:hypothetical protein
MCRGRPADDPDATIGASGRTIGASDRTIGASGRTIGASDRSIGASGRTIGASGRSGSRQSDHRPARHGNRGVIPLDPGGTHRL